MVQNVTQIKSRLTTNVGVSVKLKKPIVCVTKIFAILLYVVVKMAKMYEVLLTIQLLRVMKL